MVKPYDGVPKKHFIPLLGALVAISPMSIDMYLSALPTMAADLGASQAEMQYTLTVFFFGYCIAMLIYGPLSDILGRRNLLIIGLVIFLFSSLLCGLAPNVEFLIVMRFFQALGSAAAIILARAIARDAFPQDQLPRVLSLITIVTMIAPLVAPTLGSYILYFFEWRSIFFVKTIICLLTVTAVFISLPETLPKSEHKQNIFKTSVKNYATLLASPADMGIIGTFAFSFGAMFAFITGSPFVYIEYFGVPYQYYGYLFMLNVVGMILVLFLNIQLLKKFTVIQILLAQVSFQLIAAILLFSLNTSSIYVVVFFIVCFISMTNALGANSFTLLLTYRGNMAGSATALASSTQFALGAFASYLVTLLQDETPFAMTFVMLLFAAISFAHHLLARWKIKKEN